MEISPDRGLNWINVIEDATAYQFAIVGTPGQNFHGSAGWTTFAVLMDQWASQSTNFPLPIVTDTLLFRFTYTTDSSSTGREGWMIDDILIFDYPASVETPAAPMALIYPNPSSDLVYLSSINRDIDHLQLFNKLGQLVLESKIDRNSGIDISRLPVGVYTAILYGKNTRSVQKFVRQ